MADTKQKKKPAAQKNTPNPEAKPAGKTRRLKKPEYKSFRLQKTIHRTGYKLPGSWFLLRRSIGTIWRRWKLFLGIGIVYAGLTILLVQGLSGLENLGDVKDIIHEGLGDNSNQALITTSTFAYAILTAGTTSGADATVYQSILFVVIGLAVIWALRQAYATKLTEKIRIRDSFYRGMGQLIPFVLVILVMLVELIPAAVGAFLYNTVMANGIAATEIERILWMCLLALTVLLSLYMLLSSLFAFYIAALPDMTPMRALRSARGLVRYRRFTVLGKIIMLLLYWLVAVALVLIPIIAFVAPVASWVFFGISIASFIVFHSYLYALYRELLNE